MNVTQILSYDEFSIILQTAGSSLIAVDFYAVWCGPCKMCSPVFEELSSKYNDVLFYKVDVDQSPDIRDSLQIQAMPTFKFFKDNKQVDEVVGADMQSVEQIIKKYSIPTQEMKETISEKTQEEKDLELAMELSKQINSDVAPQNTQPKMTPEEVLSLCEKAVDAEMLKELLDVDVPKLRAVKALLSVQSRSTEAAVKWVVDHQDDKDIDDPIEIVDSPPKSLDPDTQKQKIRQSKEETKKMIEKKKAEKEEREKKERIEEEKKRREFGKKAISSNDDFKRIQAERERAELKRQKVEDAKRMKQLQEQLEKDKERRRLEKLGKKPTEEDLVKKVEPKPQEVKKVEVKKEEPKKVEVKKPEVKKEEPKKIEVKKEEPKKDLGDTCVIQLRLLDGSTKVVNFKASETVGHIRAHVSMIMNDANFNLMTPYPKKHLKDYTQTLKDAGLCPRCQLICTKGDI